MNGITIPFIKVKIPQSALLLSAIALVGGYYVGSKYIFGKGAGLYGTSPTAYAVRAYAADTNLPFMRHRIVNLLMRNAVNKNTVINNMDRILQVIGTQEPRLKALSEERATGAVTPVEFRGKLFEVVKMIASELGIPLTPQRHIPNPVPNRMVNLIEYAQSGRVPEELQEDMLARRGYGQRESFDNARASERRDFMRRVHGIGNINIM